MATKTSNPQQNATAKATNLAISTKHAVEISRHLRYKSVAYAKQFLSEVAALQTPVPFLRFNRDVGHKAGIAAGRFPQKAAREVLDLVNSVEANARYRGLGSDLKITKILANKASVPSTGGRHRRATKRTHLEIEVAELVGKKKAPSKKEVASSTKTPAKKTVVAPAEDIAPPVSKTQEKQTPAVTKKEVSSSEENSSKRAQPVSAPSPDSSTTKKTDSSAKLAEQKTPSKELSSAELLEKAQQKAAALNKKEEKDKSVANVENLYEELKKKGSLRGEKQ